MSEEQKYKIKSLLSKGTDLLVEETRRGNFLPLASLAGMAIYFYLTLWPWIVTQFFGWTYTLEYTAATTMEVKADYEAMAARLRALESKFEADKQALPLGKHTKIEL